MTNLDKMNKHLETCDGCELSMLDLLTQPEPVAQFKFSADESEAEMLERARIFWRERSEFA